MPRYREEVINVKLADLLGSYGLVADPETVVRGGLPDVLINMGGIKVILEGRFGGRASLIRDAKARIEDGLADISMALFYSDNLREARDQHELERKLRAARFDGVLCHFQSQGVSSSELEQVAVPDLVEALNSIFNIYVRNDILREKVDTVEAAIETAVRSAGETGLFFQSESVLKRLRDALGIEGEQ